MLDAYIEWCASGNAHGHLSGLGVMALACDAGNAANEWLVLSSSYWPHAANFGQSWPAFASNGFSFLSPSAARCLWHTIRWLVSPMGMGSEREAPRPLVLRHAYQSDTRRYTPRCPERTLLYRVVSENLETLLHTAREQSESGLGLPKYVEQEFREYLRCGIPCYGFTKLQCQACGKTLFLSFSCKRRGCCSSCGARRMCSTAAVTVGRVLPDVPVRQWVLSTPFEIRLLLARNAEAFSELTRLFANEVLIQYRLRAAKLGLSSTEGGALAFQHRFGGSLNLNTHLHAVFVDGVFERTSTKDNAELATCHPLPPPQPVELTAIAHDVYRKFEVWLKKKGLMRLADADEDYANEDALASCLRGSLGIGQVVEPDAAGEVQYPQDKADEQ